MKFTLEEIIEHFKLEPLPEEGGFYRETYRSKEMINEGKSIKTSIYYLVTPTSFSALHRLKQDEIFHFYAGDPVEMLQLKPNGDSEVVKIGNNFKENEKPQVIVPKGIWQGTKLVEGGSWALLGTTCSPAFDFKDFTIGQKEDLIQKYYSQKQMIQKLTY